MNEINLRLKLFHEKIIRNKNLERLIEGTKNLQPVFKRITKQNFCN